jgi:hypothetical protein
LPKEFKSVAQAWVLTQSTPADWRVEEMHAAPPAHPPARCPASLEVGTILARVPESFRYDPIMVQIHDAYAFGFANRLWNKRAAVLLAFRASMEAQEARGHGNRAARRAAQIETSSWFDHRTRMSDAELDKMLGDLHERHGSSRQDEDGHSTISETTIPNPT